MIEHNRIEHPRGLHKCEFKGVATDYLPVPVVAMDPPPRSPYYNNIC